MTDEHHADGAPRPSSWGARLRAAPLVYNGMVLLALSGLALAQPVFDLFGRNPEFFVASGATKTEIVAFALLIALAPATVGLALEAGAYAISTRAGSMVHFALTTGLALVLGLVVAHNIGIGRSLVFVAVAAVIGGLIVVGERRYSPVRQALRYLAAAPFAFLALFLFGSESASLVWADEARAEAGVTIGNPAPIVMVVLDELPTSSLMKPDGSIDEERFPNFARLAESSHWYRNATSVAPQTTESVPSGVTGVIPEERQIPTSATHPRSLFTLLGGAYGMNVIEEVTEVCPSSVCSEGAEASVGDFFSSLRHTIVDTSVVYGHVVLPPRLREELPSVGGTWAGFIDQADAGGGAALSGVAGDVQGFIEEKKAANVGVLPEGEGALIATITAAIDAAGSVGADSASASPGLFYVHESFPHFSWVTTQTGAVYPRSVGIPPGRGPDGWENDFLRRQALQRHLLQTGNADRLLGEMIDTMQTTGLWDEALFVLMADHGVAFADDAGFRTPSDANVHEIYNVPLFIKEPGQTEGEVDDTNALIIDILPTIMEIIDVEIDWPLDGRSLLGDVGAPDIKPVVARDGPSEVPDDVGRVIEVAARNAELVAVGGWLDLYAFGPSADLVGAGVDDLDLVPASGDWSLGHADDYAAVDLDVEIPVLMNGRITPATGGEAPDEVLVVLNGTVAGIGGNFEAAENGAFTFSALIAEEFFVAGANQIELLVPTPGDRFAPVRRS